MIAHWKFREVYRSSREGGGGGGGGGGGVEWGGGGGGGWGGEEAGMRDEGLKPGKHIKYIQCIFSCHVDIFFRM